jgi:eukaryotic-like serine/threonine-protein kinase
MAKRVFPKVGDTLSGKYRLIRELGRGGMGVVYEATHLGLGQRVAVKILLPGAARRPELAYRFEHEARAASRLQGAHTVRVLDVDTTPGGLPFHVLEFLEGRCLRREIARRGPLPVEEAVRYVLEACEGMAEAHAAGIVHRDLKPSNLFLSEEGGRRVVKVLDFGLAKALGNGDATFQTRSNASVGTYKYMSPEQARSARKVDARTDVWSLGVVLYELLAGRAPFEGEGDLCTLFAVATQAPPPLLERRPDLPAPLAAVVERALCKDVQGRFQTMRELFDALAPFCPTYVASSAPRSTPSSPLSAAASPSSSRASEGSPLPLSSRRGAAARVSAPGWGGAAARVSAPGWGAPKAGGRSFGSLRTPVSLALIAAAASLAVLAGFSAGLWPARPSAPAEPHPSPAASPSASAIPAE